MRNKSLLLPFGSADAVATSSSAEFASALRQFKRPVADFSFTGTMQRAAASSVHIGDLAATAAFADPMHTKCMVDRHVAFIIPLAGSGRIIRPGSVLDWTASKTIITNSYDQPLEFATDAAGTIISLRPAAEKLRSALRSVLTDGGGSDGAETEAIMARLLVRGPVIDTGSSWGVDYFSAIMNLVAMFDDCNGDGAVLERIGMEDVLNRLLANLVLDQEQCPREILPSQNLTRSTRAVDLICDHIRGSIGSPMSITQMEKLTGLTGRALNYAFRARFDCSPQEWQRNFLLDHARRLLKGTDYTGSVKSLAFQLGFSSLSSFAAFYRQRFGERPSETQSGTFRGAAPAWQEDDAAGPE